MVRQPDPVLTNRAARGATPPVRIVGVGPVSAKPGARSSIETGRAEGDREVGAVEAETRSHGSAAAIVRGSARLVPAPARRPVEIVPEVAEDRSRPAGLEGEAGGRQPGRMLTGCLKTAESSILVVDW